MKIMLPEPVVDSTFSLEKGLSRRRSVREYTEAPLSISHISQLLWAAQGITHPNGYRTAPSAGALYPLDIYIIVGMVNKIYPGIYHYLPSNHSISLMEEGDFREQLSRAALGQRAIIRAPLVIVIAAVYERTTRKYGRRGIRYVHMDSGHAAQNICLQATALGLGTVPIGAFDDEEVAAVLQLKRDQVPLYILPIGKP